MADRQQIYAVKAGPDLTGLHVQCVVFVNVNTITRYIIHCVIKLVSMATCQCCVNKLVNKPIPCAAIFTCAASRWWEELRERERGGGGGFLID